MLLLALLLQHGERQRERRDMRNMGDIGRMQVVLLRLHRHQRHSQRPVEALNGLDRIPVAAFAFADHGRPACEGSAAGGVGTKLYSVPHIGCVATNRPRRACMATTSHNSPLIEPVSITT